MLFESICSLLYVLNEVVVLCTYCISTCINQSFGEVRMLPLDSKVQWSIAIVGSQVDVSSISEKETKDLNMAKPGCIVYTIESIRQFSVGVQTHFQNTLNDSKMVFADRKDHAASKTILSIGTILSLGEDKLEELHVAMPSGNVDV